MRFGDWNGNGRRDMFDRIMDPFFLGDVDDDTGWYKSDDWDDDWDEDEDDWSSFSYASDDDDDDEFDPWEDDDDDFWSVKEEDPWDEEEDDDWDEDEDDDEDDEDDIIYSQEYKDAVNQLMAAVDAVNQWGEKYVEKRFEPLDDDDIIGHFFSKDTWKEDLESIAKVLTDNTVIVDETFNQYNMKIRKNSFVPDMNYTGDTYFQFNAEIFNLNSEAWRESLLYLVVELYLEDGSLYCDELHLLDIPARRKRDIEVVFGEIPDTILKVKSAKVYLREEAY